jgi:hypothetical protein
LTPIFSITLLTMRLITINQDLIGNENPKLLNFIVDDEALYD